MFMEEDQINRESEDETVKNSEDFMNTVKGKLNNFLERDEMANREPDYAKPEDVPAPQMNADGTYQIPGTNKIFETSEQAYAAISRYKDFAKQNGASLLIFGMSFSEYMGE